MTFNEDSRVKLPTILHLMRLGYTYLSLKDAIWDESTNIFPDIFNESIQRLNPELSTGDVSRFYSEVALTLENEDLGKSFYEKLIDQSGIRLLDFENFDDNSFHVVTELTYKKDEDEFRPDIILLINGMPLVFIEVKKPNNLDGIQAEHKRIETRFKNKKFRPFINQTQLMIFSNNMEYDIESSSMLQGAFYATASYQKPSFNFFREEVIFNLDELLTTIDDATETLVLKDNNLVGIKNSEEFLTNKNPNTPTNRICTSLLQKKRLQFILQFGIAYVKSHNGLHKPVFCRRYLLGCQFHLKQLLK